MKHLVGKDLTLGKSIKTLNKNGLASARVKQNPTVSHIKPMKLANPGRFRNTGV